MENDTEISHFIAEDECEENLETEEIQEVDLNVIPFRLIKLAGNVDVDADIVESEGNSSENNLEVASNSYGQFQTSVKGKYSKYYRQTYRPAWENMPDFKGWLKGVKGEPTRAYCTYCLKTLHAHRLSLLKHTCTIRHQKAAQIHGNPVRHNMDNFTVEVDPSNVQTVIVSEDGLITGDVDDNSDDLMQSHIVYASQSETDGADQDMSNELELEEFEESEDFTVVSKDESSVRTENNLNIIPISTSVIDTTRGTPVSGLTVSLYKLVEGRWTYINEGLTDNKGRCSSFFKEPSFSAGRYKLHYDVDKYFQAKKQQSLFPFIEIVFDNPGSTRLHFPLLLSPNSYTIYRSTCDE